MKKVIAKRGGYGYNKAAMEGRRSKELLTGIVIFSLALSIFSVGASSIGYSSPDEKRYIQSANEMVDTGDWLTPHYHGRPRFQKPILFYWLASLSISIFGKGYFSIRFPSAVSAAMTVLLTYLLGRHLYDRRSGFFSAALLCISWLFFTYARLASPDMMTLFFITSSIYLFAILYFKDGPRYLSHILFIALALGALAKGFAGFLLPLLIIASFLLIFKKEGLFKKINIPLGLAIFLVIALPWFIAMYRIHGRVYLEHIWQVETRERALNLWTGGKDIFFAIFKNLVRYILMTFVVFLPSSLFLPHAVLNTVKEKDKRKEGTLIILWIAIVMSFFTIVGTRKTHYLLSIAPAVSIMMGRSLGGIVGVRRLRMAQIFIVLSLFIFTFSFGWLIPVIGREDGLLKLSRKISSIIKEEDVVGVGSHFISHSRLEAYLGFNVKKVNADISDPEEQLTRSRGLLEEFLNKRERVFCLVIKEDYDAYIPKELKKTLFIIDKSMHWKKPNQLKFDIEMVFSILKGDRAAFDRAFKNEIYLISNKER